MVLTHTQGTDSGAAKTTDLDKAIITTSEATTAIPASTPTPESVPTQDSAKPVPAKNLYDPSKGRRFSLVVKDQRDGQTYLRSYELLGRRVKLLSKVAIAAAPEAEAQTTGAASRAGLSTHIAGQAPEHTPEPTHDQQQGWWDRTKSWLGK